jgi:hypothetical protein
MLLPLHGPPFLPVSGTYRLRAPPGGMSARPRAGSLERREWDCLYEVCHFLFLFRVTDLLSVCPVLVSFVVSFRETGMAWEMAPRKGISREKQGIHALREKFQKRHKNIDALNGVICVGII